MLPIAQYSRDCLRALRGETGIAYDERSRGTLQLFRTQRQFDDMAKDVAILGDLGVRFETLDTSGCIGAEPASLGRVRTSLAAYACQTMRRETAMPLPPVWPASLQTWAFASHSASKSNGSSATAPA
jgi:hypothetical protein